MVSLTKFVVVLLLVLPCLLSVNADTDARKTCQLVSVSATLTAAATGTSKYNTYAATIRNAGSSSVSSLKLTTSATLRAVTGLDETDNDGEYILSSKSTLGAGETYAFTYQAKAKTTVNWSVTCTTPATTQAPKATTTQAPKATTTQAPKTTKAPTTKAPTTTKAAKTTTQAPTKAPTTAKATTTQAPSKAATVSAGNSGVDSGSGSNTNAGGKTCANGWWRPAPGTTWQWQLTGTVDTSLDVQMYDIDLFDATPALIQTLHNQGKTVICYFSTQYENWRPDAAQFPAATLGNNLDDWAGEKYVDIRSAAVRAVMTSRMDLAVSKGCDGLEPDNVDGYQATTGFPLTAANQIDYNSFLANQAHARGLSVGLKNDGDQAAALQPFFDWALNEQCNQYSECTPLNVFINAGKAVFNCEYSGSPASVCPKMVTAKFSTLFKKLSLEASVTANCCTYASSNACAKVSHTCVTSAASKRSLEVEEDPAHNADENTAQEAKMSAATTHAPLMVVCAAAAAALALLL